MIHEYWYLSQVTFDNFFFGIYFNNFTIFVLYFLLLNVILLEYKKAMQNLLMDIWHLCS